MLSPADYGLPDTFTHWRDDQLEAVEQVYQSPARFNVLCAPTGFGKSLAYMAAARLLGLRTVVLTATKGLQDQLEKDYGLGAVDGNMDRASYDLRGKNNFSCPAWRELDLPERTLASEAPCNFGYRCKLKAGGCTYFDRYRQAQRAAVVVTNYQCWLHDTKKRKAREGDLGAAQAVDLLVLDEAHQAPEELAGFLEVELSHRECWKASVEWPVTEGQEYPLADWVRWAQYWADRIAHQLEIYEVTLREGGRLSASEFREVAKLKKLLEKLQRVAGITQGEQWVAEVNEEAETCKFSPLWPARYAEDNLFRGVGKIVLMSATVRPKTLDLLGVPDGQQEDGEHAGNPQRQFVEYASGFPAGMRPIVHVRSVQCRYNMSEDDLAIWGNKIDYVLTGRPDRKGIVHTVSYQRAKWLMEHTRHRGRMLTHGRADKAEVVKQFRALPPESGAVLVSPSLDTGYDFPGDQARYQVIAKLPFPDLRSAVLRQRMEVDPEYRNYLTAQDLVQISGRINRSEDDWGETLIMDDNVTWFTKQAREYLPDWWRQAYKSVTTVPPAMKKPH